MVYISQLSFKATACLVSSNDSMVYTPWQNTSRWASTTRFAFVSGKQVTGLDGMLEWVLKLVEVFVSDRNPQGLEACHGFRELLLWIGHKFSTELLLAYSRAAKPSYEMIECLRFIIYKQHKNSTSSRTFDQAKAIKNEFSANGNDIILIWYIAILFSIPVKVIQNKATVLC